MSSFSHLMSPYRGNDRRNMLRLYRRQLKDASDPFKIPEHRFRDLYRLSKDAALILFIEIAPYMSQGVKKTYIPQPLRLCAALHYFATGSFYRGIGQDFPATISKAVVRRCVREIVDILEQKFMNKSIKFPNVSEYGNIKRKFYEETGFPGVIGAIDCTHVRIKRPKQEAEGCYLNAKGYHSKNVQLICDNNLKILAVYNKFGGATEDSYIWEASRINVMLQERYESDRNNHSWLLGDSAYALSPWMITPYKPKNEDEKYFNNVHAKARSCIEKLNANLKGVFKCLQVGLYTTPKMAGKIINACTVLHNFRREHGLREEYKIIPEDEAIANEDIVFEEPSKEARRIRERLKATICDYF